MMVQRKSRGLLRSKQKLGKFRIVRRLAQGGFADVYRAYDTVEGMNVAIKVPYPHLIADRALEDFAKEVRITARLDHPNILHLKYAGYIDGVFVIVYPLGDEPMSERMKRRTTLKVAMEYFDQMLSALAFAHRKRVIHCDVKPANFILFPAGRVKLSDFGIAKLASRVTMSASGSGTMGYVAPEQAMGRPSLRSDVFSMALIMWKTLTGVLPAWPYEWPLAGHEKLRGKIHPDFIAFLRKSLEVNDRKRYRTAVEMLSAFRKIKSRAESPTARKRRRRIHRDGAVDMMKIKFREFRRRFAKRLETQYECTRCEGPVSESMLCCPWCGNESRTFRDETRFPARCRRCRRGMKLDWKFCAHCFGAGQGPRSSRSFSDVRYTSTCTSCHEPLMNFMHYCPWCRRKVTRKWKIDGASHRCHRCGWGILPELWSRCPWCKSAVAKAGK